MSSFIKTATSINSLLQAPLSRFMIIYYLNSLQPQRCDMLVTTIPPTAFESAPSSFRTQVTSYTMWRTFWGN